MSLPIGFFAPLPLPMMIAFMGIQSAVMAEQFGTNFQYGKRRISAMSNEEFNALTPEIMQSQFTAQLKGLIPEMEKQIQSMRPLTDVVIREFAEYIKLAVGTVGDLVSQQISSAAPSLGVGGTNTQKFGLSNLLPSAFAETSTTIPKTSLSEAVKISGAVGPLVPTAEQQQRQREADAIKEQLARDKLIEASRTPVASTGLAARQADLVSRRVKIDGQWKSMLKNKISINELNAAILRNPSAKNYYQGLLERYHREVKDRVSTIFTQQQQYKALYGVYYDSPYAR